MKLLLTFTLFLFCSLSFAQEADFLERSPIYDYTTSNLNNRDTIPEYVLKENKLKITGVIYKNDGVTPADNVLFYIEQANENGDFELKKKNEKRYVHHRGWIKTDSNGRYTFFTFIPGNDRRYNQLKQIFPIIKAPSQAEYELESLLFEDDPLLTKLCRKRLIKKGDPSRILTPKLTDGIFVVNKDFVLKRYNELSQ
ncbi:hypothetical protein [Lacinutrix chionoecetis]